LELHIGKTHKAKIHFAESDQETKKKLKCSYQEPLPLTTHIEIQMFRLTQLTISAPLLRQSLIVPRRLFSEVRLSDYEQKIHNILANELHPQSLEVMDISGGCGSMFAINVTSEKFKGLSMIKQHKLVNSILSEEIAKWHGLQLHTSVAK
jgi:stress-induced morphogen